MAGTPADITNMLNEALAATNKIAASQLEAAKNINDVQSKNSDKAKKLTKTIRTTVDQLNLFHSDIDQKKEKKKKNETNISSFLKTTSALIEKVAKTKTVKELVKPVKKEKTDSLEKVYVSNSVLNVRGNLIVNSKNFKVPVNIDKKSQSSEDFYRTDDVSAGNEEELKLLRSIESKLSFSNGGSSLFGELFGGLGNLAKMFVGAAGAGIGGVAGSLFGLSKFKKLGSLFKPLSKLKPSGVLKDSAKLLKNPKILIPALIAGAGYTIYDSIKAGVFTKDFDEMGNAEQREKGGPVISGKPYIVGEKGPELFKPRESGRIVPNHKLQSHTDKYANNSKVYESMFALIREQNSKSSNLFKYFTDAFKKVIDFFRPSNILELIKQGVKKVIGKVKDVAGAAVDVVKDFGTKVINTGSETVNSGLNAIGLGDLKIPLIPDAKSIFSPPSSPAAPARRIGDKNVPKDMKVSLHQDEMVIPAAQSEALRATAKLQNQPFNTKQTPQYVTKSQLGKEFWIDEFVPKFATMIKTDKTQNRLVTYDIGNIFGVA